MREIWSGKGDVKYNVSKYLTFCHTSPHSMMLCMVVPSSFSWNVPTTVVLCSTLPVSSNFSRLVLTPAPWMITVLYISGVSVKNEITVKIFVEKLTQFWLTEKVSPWDWYSVICCYEYMLDITKHVLQRYKIYIKIKFKKQMSMFYKNMDGNYDRIVLQLKYMKLTRGPVGCHCSQCWFCLTVRRQKANVSAA